MKFDKKLIKTRKETIETAKVKINGKNVLIKGTEVEVQMIPTGMSGVNGGFPPGYFNEDEEDFEVNVEDMKVEKELTEYFDEGIEPDSDEALAVKEDAEREQSEELLDSFILTEEEVEELDKE